MSSEEKARAGIEHLERGRHAEAAQFLAEAVKDKPASYLWNALGYAHLACGRLPESEDSFRQALEMDPGNSQAGVNLGALLASTGRAEEAVGWLEKGIGGVDEEQRRKAGQLLAHCRNQLARERPVASGNNAACPEFRFPQKIRELRNLTGGSLGCGWMYDEVAFFLYALLKLYKPGLIVQTGHLWGKSSCMMLEALTDGFLMGGSQIEGEEQNADKVFAAFVRSNAGRPWAHAKLVSVDPAPSAVPHSERGIEFLKTQYAGGFEFHEMPSAEFFRQHGMRLKQEAKGQRILGVVDGDHTTVGCVGDLTALHEMGAEMIFLDDTAWLPHLGAAGRIFAERNGYKWCELPFFNGIGLLCKASRGRVGNSSEQDKLMLANWELAGNLLGLTES